MLQASKESTNLDVLRSFAVLSVVVHHVAQISNPNNLGTLGRTGVLIFFVHTALVLMLSLERLDSRNLNLFKSFYVQRLFRIYPLSIVCVLVVAMGHFAAHGSYGGAYFLLSNLALVQNLTWQGSILGPLWSLPYEVQMYVILPFLYLVARKQNPLPKLIGIWIVSAMAGTLLRNSDPRYFLEQFKYEYFPLIWFMPTFLGGVVAFSLSKRKHLSLPGYYWPIFILIMLAGFEFFHPAHKEWLVGLLGLAIPQFNDVQSEVIQRISHVIAKYSYGIYLVNLPLIHLFFTYFVHLHSVLQWTGFLVSMCILSVAGYHFVEQPMIRFGRKAARKMSRDPRANPLAEPTNLLRSSESQSIPSV